MSVQLIKETQMANPNKTVGAARNRKTTIIKTQSGITSKHNADFVAGEWRKEFANQGVVVKVSSYSIGPRDNPTTRWTVRAYAKA